MNTLLPQESSEADRQARLLSLLHFLPAEAGIGLAGSANSQRLGLDAYRANAAAVASRALAAAFPTVAQLIGSQSFAALARAHWHHCPPLRGDLACWGSDLPDVMTHDPQLSSDAYLPDVARLDWAVHRAGFAADDDQPPERLALLGECDPELLTMQMRAGTAVIPSTFPIVDIWRAHQSTTFEEPEVLTPADRFAAAQKALQAGKAQAAWVTRSGGFAVQVLALDAAGSGFMQSLLRGESLAHALHQAGEAFDFEAWLILALQQQALSAVRRRLV